MVTQHDQDALYHRLTDTPDYLFGALSDWKMAAAFISDLETAIAACTENTPKAVFRLAVLHMLWGVLKRKAELTNTDDLRAQVLIDQLLEKTGRRTQAEVAHAWLEPDLFRRSQRLNDVVEALFACGGAVDEVLELVLQNLRDISEPVQHLSYLMVISRAAAKHQRTIPEEVIHEARRVMLQIPKQDVHLPLAQMLAEMGQFDAAMESVRQVKDGADRDRAMYVLSDHFKSIGKTNEAKAVAIQIGEARLRDNALSSLVVKLSQPGSFEEAEQIAVLIMDLGERAKIQELMVRYRETYRKHSENETKRRELSERSLVLARAGKIEEARRLVSTLVDARDRALILADVGFFAEARQTALDLEYLQKETLREIAVHLARTGNPRASALLDEAMQMAPDSSTSAYTQYSFFTKLTKALASIGQVKPAYWAASVIDKEFDAQLLIDVVQVLCEFGNVVLCREVVWRIMDEEERKIGQTFLAVAAAKEHAKAGHVMEAFDLVHRLSSPGDRDWGLSAVGIALAQTGDFDNALRAAIELQEGRLMCFGELAVLAAANGHPCEQMLWDTAKQIVQSDNGSEGYSALTLARYLIRTGHLQEGSIFLQEAYETALHIKDPRFQIRRICDLAVAWQPLDKKRSQAMFDHIRYLIRRQSDKTHLGLLVVALAEAGHFLQAWEVAHEVEYVDSKTLIPIIRIMIRAGKLDDARGLIVKIPGYYERLAAQQDIADELGKQGLFAGPKGAFAALEIKWLDDVIIPICSGAHALEHLEEGLMLRVICEMARIGGWAEPRWKQWYDFLSRETV